MLAVANRQRVRNLGDGDDGACNVSYSFAWVAIPKLGLLKDAVRSRSGTTGS